jgi:N-acetylglucosaminyl-diphospho-decaprenol L-rhamnosyltransferase
VDAVPDVDAVPEVAAVVVNHDSGDTLAGCVASLRADNAAEVVVVDNASSDGSADVLGADPAVRLVRTGANLGYGAGANRGIAALANGGAEFILVSNPDVVVRPGTIAALARALVADPTLAIAGPCIVGADGTRYPSARRFPSVTVAAGHALLGTLVPGNRFSRRYRMEDLDPAATTKMEDLDPAASTKVDWVSGACFLARRRALEELGGFDEAYFMYVEDVDLCWRAHRAGWGVAYVPGARITHLQGVSTARRPYSMLLAHHRSALRFASRSATRWWQRAALPGVALVLGVRLLMACAQQAFGPVRGTARRGD